VGRHTAAPILELGIWKFSKNVEAAKDFIRFQYQKENFDAFVAASNAFNMPSLKGLANHPIPSPHGAGPPPAADESEELE
jgi:ABC-type glycerol-3-phosphate transport system substrate-binding protein